MYSRVHENSELSTIAISQPRPHSFYGLMPHKHVDLVYSHKLARDEQDSKHGEADASIFSVILLNKFLISR